MNLTEEG
jgi:hypothetical protein